MQDTCEEIEVLISGYLDGELDAQDERRLKEHIEACPRCRREYDEMRRLVVGTSAAMTADLPPEEAWDRFLDTVYNRIERKTGWVALCLGTAAVVAYALALFVLLPWASPLVKLIVSLPVLGLFILFVSVLRQRLRAAKTDRYSREVFR